MTGAGQEELEARSRLRGEDRQFSCPTLTRSGAQSCCQIGLFGGTASPNSLRIAAQQQVGSGQAKIGFATADGPSNPIVPGNPLGWIDDTHLVFRSFPTENALAVWDIDAKTSVPIASVPQGANIIGTLPAGLN